MHFRKYLYWNYFTLWIDHRLLEWLATIPNAYDIGGRCINILQDFNFKIVHWARSKHTNVDALSQNLLGVVEEDEEMWEIQDCRLLQTV